MMLLAIGLFEGPLARAEERIGFESEEGFTVAGRLPGTVQTSGGAQAAVVSGVAASGSQSLRVGGEGQVLIALGDGAAAPVIYGSFSINGAPDPEREDNPTVSLGGAQIGFSASGSEGEIWIRHGGGAPEWIDTGSRFSTGEDRWLRLTVRLDEAAGDLGPLRGGPADRGADRPGRRGVRGHFHGDFEGSGADPARRTALKRTEPAL